jgi:hypothetical protein
MRADFRTNDNSQSDNQSIKADTQLIMIKAQIHAPPRNLPSDEQNFNQRSNIAPSGETSPTQNRNSFSHLPKTQHVPNKIFRSHDDQEIVMANDEAFGTLDFQHDDIHFDADNELSQQLLPTFSDKSQTQLSLDAQNPDTNAQNDSRNIHDTSPNNIP